MDPAVLLVFKRTLRALGGTKLGKLQGAWWELKSCSLAQCLTSFLKIRTTLVPTGTTLLLHSDHIVGKNTLSHFCVLASNFDPCCKLVAAACLAGKRFVFESVSAYTDCGLISPVIVGLVLNAEHPMLLERAPLGFGGPNQPTSSKSNVRLGGNVLKHRYAGRKILMMPRQHVVWPKIQKLVFFDAEKSNSLFKKYWKSIWNINSLFNIIWKVYTPVLWLHHSKLLLNDKNNLYPLLASLIFWNKQFSSAANLACLHSGSCLFIASTTPWHTEIHTGKFSTCRHSNPEQHTDVFAVFEVPPQVEEWSFLCWEQENNTTGVSDGSLVVFLWPLLLNQTSMCH